MLFMAILALLISNAVTSRRDKSILYSRVAMLILLSCLLICLNSFYLNFQDKGLGLFGGLYHATAITHVFHIFVFFVTFLILQLNSFYPRKLWIENSSSILNILSKKLQHFNYIVLNKMSEQYRIIEYPLIILFVVIGGVFLMSSSDLMSIFLSIELQSYALYILCAIYRDSERATSGALTYFLLGGLSSCFILLASSLLYGNSGNTGFDGLYVINNISGVDVNLQETAQTAQTTLTNLYQSNFLNFSMTIMSIGFLFKISAAPFHFWSPDVYDAIPTIVTTFVAVFAKISILILLLELVHYTGNLFVSYQTGNDYSNLNISWTFTLLISSLLSLIIGSVLGLTQSRIKRLYAYSTISHIGFILLALTINSVESIQSFIFYLMQYSLSNVNAFILLIAVGYSLYLYIEDNKNSSTSTTITNEITDKNNSPVQLITDIKGFFFINPMIAISLSITLFSFVGVPPLLGFFAKQMVLTSALDSGYVFLALVAILTSVISAYYYLVLVKQIFFNETDYILNPELLNLTNDKSDNSESKNIYLSGSVSTTISILTLMILLFMLSPQEWLNITTILTLIIFNC